MNSPREAGANGEEGRIGLTSKRFLAPSFENNNEGPIHATLTLARPLGTDAEMAQVQ